MFLIVPALVLPALDYTVNVIKWAGVATGVLTASLHHGRHIEGEQIFWKRRCRRLHKEWAEQLRVRWNRTMEKGKRRGRRREGWKRWAFCWCAHRGSHPQHLSRASSVASVQNAPIPQLSQAMYSYAPTPPASCVAPERGCWLMQAGDAGHSWAWLQQFI